MVYSIQTYCILEEMMDAATRNDYVTMHALNRSLGEDSLKSKRDKDFYHCRQTILQSGIDSERRETLLVDAQRRLQNLPPEIKLTQR